MIKFIHTSDWHLGRKNYNSEERFKDNFRAIVELIQILKELSQHPEKKPDFILHTGDLFHNQNVDSNTFYRTISLFLEIKELNIPVYVIRGNHDADEGKYSNTFLHSLEQVKLIHLVSTSLSSEKVVFEPVHGVRLYGVGHRYTGYRQRLKKIMVSHPIDTEYTNILALHAGVSGLEGSDNRISIPGFCDFSANYLLDLGFDYVALGHHHRKSVYQPKENGSAIAYSGSTEHWSYANWDKKHISKTKAILFIEIKDRSVKVTDYKIKVRPKLFIKEEYQGLDAKSAIATIVNLLKAKDREFAKLIPSELTGSERERYLPIINFQFTIGFKEEEHDYPFDRIKYKMKNILYSASFIRIDPKVSDEEIEFTNEEDFRSKIIEKKYPDYSNEIKEGLQISFIKAENMIETLGSVNKMEKELEKHLWTKYMEKAL